MAKGQTLPLSTYDNIAALSKAGYSNVQITEMVQVSSSSVSAVLTILRAVENDDTDRLKAAVGKYDTMIKWAYARCGKDATALFAPPAPPAPPQEPVKEDKPDNTAVAFVSIMETVDKLRAVLESIDKRMSAMQMTIQGIRQEAGENTKKVVECVNVNGDILTKEYDKLATTLEAIKGNTRWLRRGGAE